MHPCRLTPVSVIKSSKYVNQGYKVSLFEISSNSVEPFQRGEGLTNIQTNFCVYSITVYRDVNGIYSL